MPVVRCGAFGTILGTICEEATRCARLRRQVRGRTPLYFFYNKKMLYAPCAQVPTTKSITFHLLNFDLEIFLPQLASALT